MTCFDAIDGDRIEALAIQTTGNPAPDDAAMDAARDTLVRDAANVFTGELITMLDTIRRDHEQIIDHDTLDTVTNIGWAGDATENAQAIAREFTDWMEDNRDPDRGAEHLFHPARTAQSDHLCHDQGNAGRPEI